MSRCPDINDHGLIGDLQTAALITKDGTVDWFCSPRFDSPGMFASLLDAGRGGVVLDRLYNQIFERSGNFPQAFSHLALSHLALSSAAVNLNHQLDHDPAAVNQANPAR